MTQMLLSIELHPLSTFTGRTGLEGIYLSSLIPLIRERIEGSVCGEIGMCSSAAMSLRFREGWLCLNAKPSHAGLWWTESASVIQPDSPSWEHHIVGASVEKVCQQGADRVMEIHFSEKKAYEKGGVTLVFEITGRNANIILIRRRDCRILASLRKVLSSINRYRSISPGVVYRKPPSSGYPPSMWGEAEVQQKLQNEVTGKLLYGLLEGVGPVSAGAILDCSGNPADTVAELGRSITEGRFEHWKTKFGPMPCRIGNGSEITSPLAQSQDEKEHSPNEKYSPAIKELELILGRKIRSEIKKMESSELTLSRLKSPDYLRSCGGLILTWKKKLKKGMKEAVLPDWEGNQVRIGLKEALNPAENAERYFRKAGRIHLERERLEKRKLESKERIAELMKTLDSVEELTDECAADLLRRLRKPVKKEIGEPFEYILQGGWRCLAGRNALQNDRLTFRTAGRDDIWLHARGASGAHVIIRRDGRSDNPGNTVILLAAQIAVKHSSTGGLVPVDWTLVKYVRRIKGGGPGQVVYTREKTVFAQA